MNLKIKSNALLATLVLVAATTQAFAEEKLSEKAGYQAEKTGNAIKEGYRNAKDEWCETVDGKIKCLPKKVMHKTETASEQIGTEAKKVKNKVD